MIDKIKNMLIIATLIMLSGCAGSNRVALSGADLPSTTKVKVIIPYDEIIARSPPKHLSNGANGAMGDMLDSTAIAVYQSRMENKIGQLYAQIADVDFRSLFFDQFKNALSTENLLPSPTIEVSNRAMPMASINTLKSTLASKESMLIIRVNHRFSLDGRSVTGVAGAYWVEGGKATPIYQNVLFYVSERLVEKDPDRVYAQWFANKGEKLQLAYKNSADSFVSMLKIELNEANNDASAPKAASSDETKKIHIPIIKGVAMIPGSLQPPNLIATGTIVEEDEKKQIIRGGYNQSLYWIGK